MKTKKKIAFFIALISLVYCLTFMQDTYAKYVSSAAATADLTIARWSILVNNQDVVNSSDFSETITPVFEGSTNISSGVIAPTAEGYIDVVIDGSNTDVSFSYTISLDLSDCSVSDLKIVRYAKNGNLNVYSNNPITDTINLSDQTRSVTYRFYVKWNDGGTEQMNNAADTAASASGDPASFDVNVSFLQLQ